MCAYSVGKIEISESEDDASVDQSNKSHDSVDNCTEIMIENKKNVIAAHDPFNEETFFEYDSVPNIDHDQRIVCKL